MNKTELAQNYSVPELKYYILHSLGGNANHMKKLQYKDQLVNYAYNRQNMVVTERELLEEEIAKMKKKRGYI